MAKAIIPNVDGHYEMNGIEIDVTSRQIIVRTEGGRHPGRDNQPRQRPDQPREQKKEEEPSIFGPVTTKLLQGAGILEKPKK